MTTDHRPPTTTHRTIFLLGFMGSGKSTVGRALAEQLNYRFIDLDHELEKIVGCSIGELVKANGEPFFRALETECLKKAAAHSSTVIALGGGAFIKLENRELIAATGTTVWLDVPFALCWQRIQTDAAVRPLAPNQEVAQALYLERNSIYKLAKIHLAITNEIPPEEIAARLTALLNDR